MFNTGEFHTVRGYQLLKQGEKILTPAMEDYMEMIYRHSLKEEFLRINSLAALLNVQASSTTKMVQKLARMGLVKYRKYGIILLTDKGKKIGKFLLKRHETIETFLKFLGVDNSILVETELVEHNISSKTAEKIELFNKFMKENPEFMKKFKDFKKNNK